MPGQRLAGRGCGTMLRAAMPDRAAATPPTLMWTTLAPAVFVVLWSTGFIFAKMGLPYAEPFTFVAFALRRGRGADAAGGLLLRASWPERALDIAHLVIAGLLLHAVYIGGVFCLDLSRPARGHLGADRRAAAGADREAWSGRSLASA